MVKGDALTNGTDVAREHSAAYGVDVRHVYRSAVQGYSGSMSQETAEIVARDDRVIAVDADQQVEPLGQALPTPTQRIFAADFDCDPSDNDEVNSNFDIDCIDDSRVDVDVAVLDTGIDAHSDLDVFRRADCTVVVDVESTCVDGGGYDSAPNDGGGHGTTVAQNIGGIDNGISSVGTAPGARLWSVKVLEGAPELSTTSDPERGLAHVIAGIDWVHAHSDEVEVLNMSLGCKAPWQGPGDDPNPEVDACDNSPALHAAIDALIDAGVVVVVAAGNHGDDTDLGTPQNHPGVINVSLVTDFDGHPGGLAGSVTCGISQDDDTLAEASGRGAGVEIAAPGPCGGTSGASARVAGAAAALASQCDPGSADDVRLIADTLMAEGNYDWIDDSGDGYKEPLLDVGDEGVFDPVMVGGAPQPTGCVWRSRRAESDVDGDGRSDLVLLDSLGVARVFGGRASGVEVGSSVSSVVRDPALLDGVGHYVVDVADVTGDGRSDFVSMNGGVPYKAFVHPGGSGGGFGAGVEASMVNGLKLNQENGRGVEPLGVADVNGDGRADLVFQQEFAGSHVQVWRGRADGTFEPGAGSLSSSNSALFDGVGRYFLDVVDVDGDGLSDLVSIDSTGSVLVARGQSNSTFAAAVVAGSVDPVMDDGVGQEPVGLGDVDRDGRADLVTLDGGALKLYAGQVNATFAAPVSAYAGGVDSGLLDGSGAEFVGLLDYSRDGRADLVALDEGDVLTYTAQPSGTFGAPVVHDASIDSVRGQHAAGHEPATEKPMLRRQGCQPTGCVWSIGN